MISFQCKFYEFPLRKRKQANFYTKYTHALFNLFVNIVKCTYKTIQNWKINN